MYNKNTYAQVREIVSNGGEMWAADEEGLKKAKPGDLIFTHEGMGAISASMFGKYIPTQHVMIYIGDNKIAHASTQNKPVPKQIRIDDVSGHLKSYNFFARPKDLIDADKNAVTNSKNSDVTMENGKIKIDGKEFPTLATIKGAVCTSYCASSYMGGGSTYSVTGRKYKDIRNGQTITVPTEGSARDQVKYCASHNLPFGTQVYIPKLKEKGLGDGILMVVDNGGHVFDFDINMTDAQANKFGGKQNCDVYVLKWGEDKAITTSFIGAARGYSQSQRQQLSQAWRLYTKMNGKLISFWKFKTEDKAANVKSILSPAD